MNDNLLNQVVKTLVSNARTSLTNPDLKSQVLAKSISAIKSIPQTPTDSITQSSSAEELLTSYQLPIEEENLNIVNSYLNKGVSPSKEEIENIKEVLKNLPSNGDLEKTLENSVKSSLHGLDLKNEIIQESVSSEVNKESVQKELQDLKTAVIKDKSIPTKVRVEIANEIDQIQKEIEQSAPTKEPSNANNSSEEITDKIKTATSQNPDKSNQSVVNIVAKGLERINEIIEEGVSGQIQKDEVFRKTNDLFEDISRLTDKLASDRKSLIEQIDNTATEFANAKNSIQESIKNLLENQDSNESTLDQSIVNSLQEKIPVFLKSLSSSEEILSKFGAYIASFPQSQKSLAATNSDSIVTQTDSSEKTITENNNPTTPTEVSKQSIKNILNSLESTPADKLINSLETPIEKLFNVETPSENTSDLSNNSTFKLLSKVSIIAESLQDNLQAIKKVINQTTLLPASTALKDIVKIIQEDFPEFFKSFESLNLDIKNFPEFEKTQNYLLANPSKGNNVSALSNETEIAINSGKIKTINLEQFSDELEQIERERFKFSDSIQSLKKVHELVNKSETKLVVHQLLENSNTKPEIYHAFELSINPLQENRLAKVEIQQNRKADEIKAKSSFSVNIEVDLTQTGAVKARLFSDENAKQIFLNFADNDFKKLAIENQEELQTQLKEIPFISQLFFGNINKPAELDPNFTNQNTNTPSGVYKFDSLA